MPSDFQHGDKVRWNTPQGETHGVVERKETRTVTVGGTKLKGSEDDPVYIVTSGKTGKQAGHKASGLKRA